MRTAKWKIAVLCGGDSSERDVSIETGEAVAAALDQRGHSVRLVDVRGHTLEAMDRVDCDLAFVALHGAFGEDGQVQLLLETRGISYTGSGVEASRLAMDKPAAKERFLAAGVSTPGYFVLTENSPREDVRAAVVAMGFPQIIKPAREGSSVGVSMVRSVPEAMRALEECFELDTRALVERRIRGRELTVAILGDRPLPIIELIYPGPTFSKHNKYTPGATKHVINPQLAEGVAERVHEAALSAHNVLGCRDISRVDLILADDNTPYILEVNTIPGMTDVSLVPDAARAANIEFDELCEIIAHRALRRAAACEQQHKRGEDEWASDEKL